MIALLLGPLVLALPQRQAVPLAERPLPAASAPRPGAVLRLHEAGHLTGDARLAALEAELARLSDPGDAAAALAGLEALRARRQEVESIRSGLLEAVREHVQPALEVPEHLEALAGGRLAFLGLPEQHEWLASFLREAATFQGLIDIQARVWEVPRGALPAPFQEAGGRALDPAAAADVTARLAALGLQPTTAPRVMVWPFREAELAVVEQIPYVGDFELKVVPGLTAGVADPVVSVAEHGPHLSLRAIPTADGGLLVQAELEYVRVRRPIATATVELVPGVPVEVQLPEISRAGIEGHFRLGPGQLLLLHGPADAEEELDVLVLLQARRVPEAPAEGR